MPDSKNISSKEYKWSQTGLLFLVIGMLLALSEPVLAGQTKYVIDQFEITMRSGTSVSNSIVRMLKSGDRVTVLEEDLASQYSLVETSDGKQGYILSRFLDDKPVARQQIVELQAQADQQRLQLSTQSDQISKFSHNLESEKRDNTALKAALLASEQELAQVRHSAENTLNILEKNRQLETMIGNLRKDKNQLDEENSKLRDKTRIDWFIRGAAVFLLAFAIGILVTRIRWKKEDSWGSY